MYTCIIFLINYFQMITVFQEQPVFHKMRGICVVVQSLNCVRLFVSLWTAAHQAPWPLLSPRVCSDSCPLSRLMSTESVMLSNHLISSSVAPFFLLQSFPASGSFPKRWPLYSNQVAKVLELQLQPSYKHSGLISSRMDGLELLTVQGTLRSLLQHHNSKAVILWHSAFFMIQFSHLYMTTGKTITLAIWTFVGKVMSLLFNTLSRFVTGDLVT